jgi:hypothetical protein
MEIDYRCWFPVRGACDGYLESVRTSLGVICMQYEGKGAGMVKRVNIRLQDGLNGLDGVKTGRYILR